MKPPAKFNPLFDKFLLGGLGCGLVTLCFVMAGFFYVWKNPPRPNPTPAPTQLVQDGLPTPTPLSAATATPSAVPSGLPTLVTPTQAGPVISSPAPQFDSSPPMGQIVFTCYVN